MTSRCLCLLLLALAAQAQDRPNLVPDGGFEAAPTTFDSPGGKGSVSGGWHENSSGWAHVTAAYEVRGDQPHGGKAYQRIVGEEIQDGRVQMQLSLPDLAANTVYEGEAWMRSPSHTSGTFILRQPGAPYKTFAEGNFLGNAEWTRVRWRYNNGAAQPACLLVLLDGVGTVDVDDVSVRAAGSQSDAPAQTGNLAALGRLGAGPSGGWSVSGQNYTWLADATEGPGAAKLVLGPNARLTVEMPPRFLRYGVAHSVSLQLKSQPAGANVSVAVRATDDGRGFQHAATTTTEWQRLTASGKIALSRDERHYLQLSISGNNTTVWLDGLTLTEGEPADAKTDLPAGVGLAPVAGWGVVAGAEPMVVALRAVGAPAGSQLRLALTHVNGQTADLPPVALGGKPVWQGNVPITGDLARLNGLLRIRALVTDTAGKALSPPAETLIGRVPTPVPGPRPNSAFGTHVTLREPDVAAVAKLGFKWCRLHDASILTKWALVEPKPGEWTWYDAEMALARRSGLSILGMLCSSPPWASGHPNDTGYFGIYWPPKDVNQWREYVRRTVGHYKGVIDRWEVWNEPWGNGLQEGFFRGGTPEQYAELLKAAYAEAKQANPNCTILGIDTYNADWDSKVLAAGAYGSYDLLSYHRYESSFAGGPDDVFAQNAARLKAAQAKYGPAKPLEDTEGGPGTTSKGSFFSFADAEWDGDWSRWADQVPRYYVGCQAAGVTRFYLYSLHSAGRFGQPDNWMLTEPGYLLKPLIVSTSAMIGLLEGAKWTERLTPAKGASAHRYTQPEARWYGPGGSVVAVLISDGENDVPLTKPLPAGVKAYDRWANPCALPTKAVRAPVYLVASGAAATALRVALTP